MARKANRKRILKDRSYKRYEASGPVTYYPGDTVELNEKEERYLEAKGRLVKEKKKETESKTYRYSASKSRKTKTQKSSQPADDSVAESS